MEAAAAGRELIGPVPAPANNNDGRFTTQAFQVEVEQRRATCPAGQSNSQCSRLEEKATGKVAYRFEWDTATCAACPLRGMAKTKLQNYFTGAACNVKRWLRRLAWEMGQARVAGPSLAATAQ